MLIVLLFSKEPQTEIVERVMRIMPQDQAVNIEPARYIPTKDGRKSSFCKVSEISLDNWFGFSSYITADDQVFSSNESWSELGFLQYAKRFPEEYVSAVKISPTINIADWLFN